MGRHEVYQVPDLPSIAPRDEIPREDIPSLRHTDGIEKGGLQKLTKKNITNEYQIDYFGKLRAKNKLQDQTRWMELVRELGEGFKDIKDMRGSKTQKTIKVFASKSGLRIEIRTSR